MASARTRFSVVLLVVWLVLLGGTVPSSVVAESMPEPSLSFNQFRTNVLEVLLKQPELSLETSRKLELENYVGELAAQRFPQVRFGLQNRIDIASADRTAFDQGSRLDAVVSASQVLYDFGSLGHRISAAKRSVDAQFWQQQAISERILFEIITAHYEVARNQQLETLARENVAAHAVILAQVESRATAGAESKAEFLRARSQWFSARSTLASIRRTLEMAEFRYAERTREPPAQLRRPANRTFTGGDSEVSKESDYLSRNPEYLRLLQEVELAHQSALAVESDAFPVFSLELQGRRFDVNRSELAENDLAIVLSVDYDLFSGNRQDAQARQASARKAQSEFELQIAARRIFSQAESAREDLFTLREAVDLARMSLEADEALLDAYKTQFQVGRRTLSDVLDAQRDYFESSRRNINAIYDYDLAHYQSFLYEGKLLHLFMDSDSVSGSQPASKVNDHDS